MSEFRLISSVIFLYSSRRLLYGEMRSSQQISITCVDFYVIHIHEFLLLLLNLINIPIALMKPPQLSDKTLAYLKKFLILKTEACYFARILIMNNRYYPFELNLSRKVTMNFNIGEFFFQINLLKSDMDRSQFPD